MQSLLLLFVSCASAGFYLPGLAPLDHLAGEGIVVMSDAMHSPYHPNEPLDYFSLAFCPPRNGILEYEDDIGEHLLGKSLQYSAYNVSVLEEQRDIAVCSTSVSREAVFEFQRAILEGYKVNLLLDNLPNLYVTEFTIRNGEKVIKEYELGNDIGYVEFDHNAEALSGRSSSENQTTIVQPQPVPTERSSVWVYSHVDINVDYHAIESYDGESNRSVTTYRIVGFKTFPDRPVDITRFAGGARDAIDFTYSVYWHPSNVTWGSRWDVYFYSNHELTSTRLMQASLALGSIFVFASALVLCTKNRLRAHIMRNSKNGKALRKYRTVDGALFMDTEDEEDKSTSPTDSAHSKHIISANIFRKPRTAPALLVSLVCIGQQILAMLVITGVLGLFSMIYIEQRGMAINVALLAYISSSLLAGYKAMQYCQLFAVAHRKTVLFLTWIILPLCVFPVLAITNAILQSRGTTSALEWWVFGSVVLVWAMSTLFLMLVGASFGARRKPPALPCKPDNNVIQTPAPSLLYDSFMVHLFRAFAWFVIAGVGAVPIRFIVLSIWGQQFYAMYGIFWLALATVFYFAAIVSIFFVYQQLKYVNWLWYWSSYLTAAGAAFPLFGLLASYYAFNSEIESGHATVLYFAYALLFAIALFLAFGAVGFMSTFWFLKSVFAQPKGD